MALNRMDRIQQLGYEKDFRIIFLEAKGDGFQRLFEKLDIERQTLGGRVFDILGEVFEDCSLKDLLIDAIRYGADPEVRAQLLHRLHGRASVWA